MLNFLKKIFASAAEPAVKEQVTDIAVWFDEKTKQILPNLPNAIAAHYSAIKTSLEELKANVASLESAAIKEPERIEQRIKNTVTGNRDNYVKQMKIFANNLAIPQSHDYKSALEFCTLSQVAVDNIGKNTHKSYYTAQHLFFEQVEAIAKSIKKIDSEIRNLRADIGKSNAERIDSIKEKIKAMLEQKEGQELLKSEVAALKTKKDVLEKQKLEAEKIIKEFEESKEYKDFRSVVEEDDKINNEIKIVKTEILNLFSPLEPALKKFARITTMHEELVEQYAEDPINTFMNDKQLNILIILQNLKKNIEADSIELKDTKREKSLERINEITREKLNFINAKLEALKIKRKKFSDSILSNDVLRKKKSLFDDLNRIKRELQSAEQAIAATEKRSSSKADSLKEEIKKEIREVLNIIPSF